MSATQARAPLRSPADINSVNYGYLLILGYNAGSSGTYSLSGSGQCQSMRTSTLATPAQGPSRSPAENSIGGALATSISATTPAATARTASAAAATVSCHTASTWAIPARAAFTQSGGTNIPATISISATTPAAAARTALAATASCRRPTRVRRLLGHRQLHAVGRNQHHRLGLFESLSRQQSRQQRHVQSQRQRPVVGSDAANTSATPARAPSRSPAGPTISPALSISATTPAAAARTTSAATAALGTNV